MSYGSNITQGPDLTGKPLASGSMQTLVRQLFDRMLREVGIEAAAAYLSVGRATVHAGTLSKKRSGAAPIAVWEVAALEEMTGSYPVTQMLFRRMGQHPQPDEDLGAMAARLARESGEAMAAILEGVSAGSEAGSALTPDERAKAICEVQQVHDVTGALIALLQDGGE